MLGLRSVLFCACIVTITNGALLVSREILSEDTHSDLRHLKKRSPVNEEDTHSDLRHLKKRSPVNEEDTHGDLRHLKKRSPVNEEDTHGDLRHLKKRSPVNEEDTHGDLRHLKKRSPVNEEDTHGDLRHLKKRSPVNEEDTHGDLRHLKKRSPVNEEDTHGDLRHLKKRSPVNEEDTHGDLRHLKKRSPVNEEDTHGDLRHLKKRSPVNEEDTHSDLRHLKKRSPVNEEGKVEIRSVKMASKVAFRFAQTILTSNAINRANSSKEVFFDVELPKTAFITNFSMEIDGKEYVGEVKEKRKARKQYQAAVSRGQTAALVKASGRKMEKFSVSVNVAAQSEVTFKLTYEELLKRTGGNYELMTRLKPKQLIQSFEIVVDIYEPRGIAFLDAYGTFSSNDLLSLVDKTVTDTKAHISFTPTIEQQRTCPDCDGTLIDGDFIVKYDVKRKEGIGDLEIVNGFFVHFFSPPNLPYVPKNIVFVIDISGSMSGTKMRQTREALLTILADLDEDDYFGIILFDHRIMRMKPSLIKATKENVEEAKTYVREIDSHGSTDINGGVIDAIRMLQEDKDNKVIPEKNVPMVILLTDGQPNSGESRLDQIQKNVREAMSDKMTLFSLGFGYDVDFNFLDVMAKENNGWARRIYEDSDAALQLHGFYLEISQVLLTEVNVVYPEDAVDSVTNYHFKHLFNGSEIVIAGRMSDNDLNNFLVEVSALGSEDTFSQKGLASTTESLDWNVAFPGEEYIFGDFTERLWAYLTIQQLLSKKDSGPVHERANATARALELSLKYNFVTPLTSMVATKPQSDEAPADPLIADKLTEDERGRSTSRHYQPPVYHHYPVTSVDADPHFIISVPKQNDSLCFNIDDAPGTIFNLVRDPLPGIVVNGQTIGDKKVDPGSKINTYFGRFGIVHQKIGLQLEVTTEHITLLQDGTQTSLSWSKTASVKQPSFDLQVKKDRSLTVAIKDSVKFLIILHKVWAKHPYHRDYLGFYTLDSHLLSPSVHGLLGQFYKDVHFEIGELHHGDDPDKPDATMKFKGSEISVTRGWQRDFRWDSKNGEQVPCWFIHTNGTGLIDGTASDYIVSGIFKTN